MKDIYSSSQFQKGTIVLSIDDGNSDDFRIYEKILSKHRLPATFNIVSGTIGEPTNLTVDQLRILYSDPSIEIASHGFMHKNDEDDILSGIEMLREMLSLTDSHIGFASPGSKMKNDFVELNAEHLKGLGLLYVRTAENPNVCSRHIEIQNQLRKNNGFDYVIKNIPQLMYSFDRFCINSVVVFNHTTLDDLMTLVDVASQEKACVVFMFHRIKKPGELNYENTWSYDYDNFEKFAGYLAKKRDDGEIHILTTRQAFSGAL